MSCGDGGGAGVNGWSVAVTVRELDKGKQEPRFRDICSNRAAEYPSGTPKMLGSGRQGRCWAGDSRHGTAGTCLHRVGTMPVLLYNLISCQCRFFCK